MTPEPGRADSRDQLGDLLGDLLGARVGVAPELLQVAYRPRGVRLREADDVVLVRSGSVGHDGEVTSDATLLLRGGGPGEGERLLAVDVETTGLDRRRDRLVAVGWVPVDGDRIDLAGARRFVVRGEDPGAAAAIHGLTHEDLAAGTPLPEVLAELRSALAGRALLAHHARFDHGFLRAAHRRTRGRMPRVPVVCTLALQRRLLRADPHAEWPEGALKLWVARRRYGLPAGRPHDALGDALACAELYLGQLAELSRTGPPTVEQLRIPTGWRHEVRRRYRRWRWRVRRRLSAGSR